MIISCISTEYFTTILGLVFHNDLKLKIFVDFHLPLGTGGGSVVFFLWAVAFPLLNLEASLGVSTDLETCHVTWKQGCVPWYLCQKTSPRQKISERRKKISGTQSYNHNLDPNLKP